MKNFNGIMVWEITYTEVVFFFYNNDDHILQTNNWTFKQKKVYI